MGSKNYRMIVELLLCKIPFCRDIEAGIQMRNGDKGGRCLYQFKLRLTGRTEGESTPCK